MRSFAIAFTVSLLGASAAHAQGPAGVDRDPIDTAWLNGGPGVDPVFAQIAGITDRIGERVHARRSIKDRRTQREVSQVWPLVQSYLGRFFPEVAEYRRGGYGTGTLFDEASGILGRALATGWRIGPRFQDPHSMTVEQLLHSPDGRLTITMEGESRRSIGKITLHVGQGLRGATRANISWVPSIDEKHAMHKMDVITPHKNRRGQSVRSFGLHGPGAAGVRYDNGTRVAYLGPGGPIVSHGNRSSAGKAK